MAPTPEGQVGPWGAAQGSLQLQLYSKCARGHLLNFCPPHPPSCRARRQISAGVRKGGFSPARPALTWALPPDPRGAVGRGRGLYLEEPSNLPTRLGGCDSQPQLTGTEGTSGWEQSKRPRVESRDQPRPSWGSELIPPGSREPTWGVWERSWGQESREPRAGMKGRDTALGHGRRLLRGSRNQSVHLIHTLLPGMVWGCGGWAPGAPKALPAEDPALCVDPGPPSGDTAEPCLDS